MNYQRQPDRFCALRCSAFSLFVVFGAVALAQDEPTKTPDTRAAVERSLVFLSDDALAWKAQYGCVSCHHASLAVRAMTEARSRGYGVNEQTLADLKAWMAESGDGSQYVTTPPPEQPKALNLYAVFTAETLGTIPDRDAVTAKNLETVLAAMKADQTDDGSWVGWPTAQPPLFGKPGYLTTIATTALLPETAGTDEVTTAARERGLKWLAENPSESDAQEISLRLILAARAGRPADEQQPLIDSILGRQNADGGWSQTPEMASDAYATGQAIVALSHTGRVEGDPAIDRARAFLVATQKENGAWPMQTRVVPPPGKEKEFAPTLIPITYAGTTWAVMGLVRTEAQPAK